MHCQYQRHYPGRPAAKTGTESEDVLKEVPGVQLTNEGDNRKALVFVVWTAAIP